MARRGAVEPTRFWDREGRVSETGDARAYSSDMTAVVFVAGSVGLWRIERVVGVRGRPLPAAARLERIEGDARLPLSACAWALRGVTSHARYVTAAEKAALEAVQPSLGRAEASRAALIPIRKTPAWWALAQDERRAILEESSHHIALGLEYLPAVARRLYHARELGEPFDFLTWFEFSAEHTAAFDTLVARLRGTDEWQFVEREVEIRVARE
jgi:Chlorite dismutase